MTLTPAPTVLCCAWSLHRKTLRSSSGQSHSASFSLQQQQRGEPRLGGQEPMLPFSQLRLTWARSGHSLFHPLGNEGEQGPHCITPGGQGWRPWEDWALKRQFPARSLHLRKWLTRTLELSSTFLAAPRVGFLTCTLGSGSHSSAHFPQTPLLANPVVFITGVALREQGPLSYLVVLPETGPGSQWVLCVALV